MNTIGYFEIQSSNPSREIDFYAKVFGWKFTRVENIPIEYYSIETQGINGGLMKRLPTGSGESPAQILPREFGTNAFVNSVLVDNYDATATMIVANGGTIALPKFAIPGKCWQGYFLDADNNTFGIFEVDPDAK